jgi:hypothetical protein
MFHHCISRSLSAKGLTTLGGVIQAIEYEQDEKIKKGINIVLTEFHTSLKEIAKCSQSDVENEEDNIEVKYMRLGKNTVKDVNLVTVKEMQILLKQVLEKTEVMKFNDKLKIETFDNDNIKKLRKNCKNPKLRNIYFLLFHGDFYTGERMKKFKMSDNDECSRCGNKETLKHMMWECSHTNKIWQLYNNLMDTSENSEDKVLKYGDVFLAGNRGSTALIKMNVIRELIQIERPKNWSKERFEETVKNIIKMEKYNFTVRKEENKFKIKWRMIENKLSTYNI